MPSISCTHSLFSCLFPGVDIPKNEYIVYILDIIFKTLHDTRVHRIKVNNQKYIYQFLVCMFILDLNIYLEPLLMENTLGIFT